MKRSAKQAAAGRKFAAAGRAAQAAKRAAYAKSHHGAKLPRSKGQAQAARKWAAAGQAAQAARRQGKVPPKKAAAVMPAIAAGMAGMAGWWLTGANDAFPTCAVAAVANHLLAVTGLAMTDEEAVALHALAGDDDGAVMAAVLEALRASGLPVAGGCAKLTAFRQADEGAIVPGLVAVTVLPQGRHAVLAHPGGMVSWGAVRPWEGTAAEAWALEWET